MIRFATVLALLAAALSVSAQTSASDAQQDPGKTGQMAAIPGGAAQGIAAVVRGLDKVDGQTRDAEIPAGGSAALFGLEVDVAECRYPANNPTGDAYAYLTVREAGGNGALFQGWMIASSPALNAMDHNRYDIWVIRCSSE